MVRFFIKGISFLAALLLAVIPALFWLPTGSWLVLPAAQYFGERMSPQIKVERVEGSLWEGYSVSGLQIVSGDELYLSLNRAAASPDWGLILAGNPWLKSLEVEGLSSDTGHLQALAEHFGGEKEEESSSSLSIRPMPLNLSIRDVNLASPQANLRLSSLLLDEGGHLSLQARANDVPVEGEARIGFEPLTLISSDMNVGTGHLSMKGSLEPPLDFRADLVALSIETLLALVPDPPVRAAGRLDGRVLLKSSRSDFSDPLSGLPVGLSASGVLSVPRGIVEDIPLSLRVPWSWKDGVFSISEASLRTKAAEAALDASVDLRRGLDAALVTLKGDAKNISLREIGRIAAPEAGLAGEGGQLHFDLSAGLDGDLGRIAGGLSLRLPEVSATGLQALSQQKIRLVKGLNADFRLKPGNAPELSCSGEVFGGRLSGRGEVERRGESLRPSAVLSLDGVDLAALVAAIPDLKGLKPSGRVSLNARVAEDLSVTGRVTSSRFSIAGVTLQDLATDLDYRGGTAGARLSLGKFLAEGVAVQDIDSNFSYNTENGRAVLDYLTGQVGRGGSLSASGTANVKAQSLDFRAAVRSLDPRSIPQLKSSGFQGLCDLEATVGGTFADPDVSARLRGRNNSVANVSLGNLDLSASYAKHQLSVPETRLKLPGGTLVFGGTVGLADPSNPRLDIAAATTTMNLAQISRALKLKEPVTGIVQGDVRIKGPLRTASAAVHLRADDVRTGEVRIAHATLNARGDRGQLNIDKLDAVIGASGGADAHITGKGRIAAGKKDLMDSAVNLGLTVRGLELRPLLNRFAVNAPVGGTLNGNVNVKGTLARPTLDMKVVSPLSVSQFIIDTLSLSVRSPARDRYALAASAKIGELNLALDGDVRKQQKGWDYTFTTKPLDVAKLLTVFAPSAKGLASGQVRARVNGSAPGTGPIGVRVSLPKLILMDKVTVEDITLPISVSMQDNRVSIREAQAILSEGLIRAKVDVDLAASSWKGNASVKRLDLGKLSAPFLPVGELVGKLEANVDAKGSFGVFAQTFANGNFSTGSGYLHKLGILDRVTPTKRLSFEKIRGSFFWNGADLFLNPGSQAIAGPDEPLYRYFAINGSMGIPGKGLKLMCDGRFDLKILDQLLGAMKGVFQYMTGGLTGSGGYLRDAVGRMLGLKRRDYQNVSFTLANSWNELRLLNLKITKPIQDFLPVDILNKSEGQQKDDKQFKLNLKFPTGRGSDNPEDVSTSDQFKEQLIDNLFRLSE